MNYNKKKDIIKTSGIRDTFGLRKLEGILETNKINWFELVMRMSKHSVPKKGKNGK